MNSYMITSRATDGSNQFSDAYPTPIDPKGVSGAMYFLMSNQAYDPTWEHYSFTNAQQGGNYVPSTALPATFAAALKKDLAGNLVNGKPQLTIYIHGLEVTYADAIEEMASLGSNLTKLGPYPGLVIGFSWPSGDPDAAWYAITWPAKGDAPLPTVRDNIVNSAQAFVAMIQGLLSLVPNLGINIICHSEGNYMLMRGMFALSALGGAAKINQVIMLAADISNAALQLAAADNGNINGRAIATLSKNVTVYSSIYDEDVLMSNIIYLKFHNPKYPLRLGQTGVYSYLAAGGVPALPGNVVGLDCSAVVNDGNIINLVNQGIIKLVPAGFPALHGIYLPFIHSSYRYIPQVLADVTAVMIGSAPVDRVAIPKTNNQGFQMRVADTVQASSSTETPAA